MRALLPLPMAFLLCFNLPPTHAADGPDPRQALARLAPELRHLDFVMAQAEGDLNGDGIADVALLLTGSKGGDAPREERLVVLAGLADGAYKLLSVSGEFCHPSKFYNLDLRERSLFVEAVQAADASRHGSSTLQFRYSARLGDLDLIGEEMRSVEYGNGDEERTSSNFLTGQRISTVKHKGKTRTKTERIANPAHPALSGWACGG